MPDAGFGTPPGAPLSNSLPLANGAASAGTSGAASRADHTHPASASVAFNFGSYTSRSLALGTAYQATDPTKAALVTINLTSTANFSLIGGTTNTADIVVGPTNAVAGGTGTVAGKYANSSTAGVAVGIGVSSIQGNPVVLALPAGWFFAVRQTAGAVSITSAFDQAAA